MRRGGDVKGYSVPELLVVLAIMGILLGVGLGFYAGYVENARVTRARHQLYTIQSACESFYAVRRVYPASAAELGEAGFPAAGEGPFELEARDPWGRPYQYRVEDGAKAYMLETGYNRVQGVTGRLVLASGREGRVRVATCGRGADPGAVSSGHARCHLLGCHWGGVVVTPAPASRPGPRRQASNTPGAGDRMGSRLCPEESL